MLSKFLIKIDIFY